MTRVRLDFDGTLSDIASTPEGAVPRPGVPDLLCELQGRFGRIAIVSGRPVAYLAPHIPERLPAGNFSSICGTFIGGIHPDTGRQYTIIEPQIGGWGAWEGQDGNPCIFSGFHGETYNTPAEISEARNGLYVDRMALNTASGGAGEYTGGRGLILEYRIRTENGFVTAGYTRSRIKPWSLEGGEEGSGNFIEVIKPEGKETYSFVSGLSVTTDDVIRVITSSGAGYGDPKQRSRDAVREDVKNGLVSEEDAREIYALND